MSPFTSTGQTRTPDYGPTPAPALQRELLTLREGVWRAWFANDQDAFRRLVPAELVALSWSGGPWDDRAQTMARMRTFAGTGQRLVSLEFPRNVFQQYGDVVVLYTTFRLVLLNPQGARVETRGRGTEVFVRRAGHWIHTGWHLDTVTDPERAPRSELPC